MENNENNTFSYTYTALSENERKEVNNIKNRYVKQNDAPDGKIKRLRKMDAMVRTTAKIIGLSLGVVGVLIFGTGLACVLEWNLWVLGICLMVGGCLPVAFAYPVHNLVQSICAKKYGAEIVRLSDEILAENQK